MRPMLLCPYIANEKEIKMEREFIYAALLIHLLTPRRSICTGQFFEKCFMSFLSYYETEPNTVV